jgi:predicted MFS family arabinose efflux permease
MLDVLALAITGMGSGLVLVPSVPLMVACTRSVSGGADLTDAVSSIYSSSWSMGELLGPPLGGLMLERLPKVTYDPTREWWVSEREREREKEREREREKERERER